MLPAGPFTAIVMGMAALVYLKRRSNAFVGGKNLWRRTGLDATQQWATKNTFMRHNLPRANDIMQPYPAYYRYPRSN